MLEAVVYDKVEMIPAFITEFDIKTEQFKNLVRERDRSKRMVICCKDMKTTGMLSLMVSEVGEKATVLHSGQDMHAVRSRYERGLDTPSCPLVVSDDSLTMVGADRGTILVHWDIPTDSKTTFSLRFFFVKSGVRSIFISGSACPCAPAPRS